jgi:hypothetical protein
MRFAMLIPRFRRVSSRIRSSKRFRAFGDNRRLVAFSLVKLNPRNFRTHGTATALFSLLTFSFSFFVMKSLMLPITRCPARSVRT